MNYLLHNNMHKIALIRLRGFTLLEILIALFIFTILSTLLATALHSVINANSGTEKKAQQLRHLQKALLVMSRDIEQTLDRPVVDAYGKEEATFIGSPQQLILTHAGIANPADELMQTTLQRVEYECSGGKLWRAVWPMLDQAATSAPPPRRIFLADVTEARFEYAAQDGRFHADWPAASDNHQPLPRAVRIQLTLAGQGQISQTYIIPTEPARVPQQ
jgi:general secretion pathway protein J